jgi:ABC-type polysaccharide/polyol phosphate export permease
MGIPYSRQINAAFEQVTPLVAAGYKVLSTTRDISILLAIIQVLTVLLLGLILLVLVALMYCVNPDLEVILSPSLFVSMCLVLPTSRPLATTNYTTKHRL